MYKIYLAHPYTGNEQDNINSSIIYARCIYTMYKKQKGDVSVFNPLTSYMWTGEMLYEDVMRMCLDELSKCDMVVTCGDKWKNSNGVNMEIELSKKLKIPVVNYIIIN